MLLSITQRLLLIVALIVTVTAIASARTVSYTGPCPGGGTWLVVITIDPDGNVTDRAGFNCAQQYWTDHCVVHPADPAKLPDTSDYFEPTENGLGWVRFNLDATKNTVRMWGKTASGAYWEADAEQPHSLQ